jgi:hypothetical protein
LDLSGNASQKLLFETKNRKDKHSFFRADVHLYKAEEGKRLEPNTYVFPFSVKLPKSLPSSCSYEQKHASASFTIEYNLELKTKDRGEFSDKKSFLVTSAHPEDEPAPCVLQPKPVSLEDLGAPGKGRIFMGARVKSTNVSRGQPLVVSLASKNQSTCEIERVEVTLEEEYYWTTDSKGGYGKTTLVEELNVGSLRGLRLSGIRRSESANDESIAKKMYRDLRSKHSELTLMIPQTAHESYTGLVVKISHYLKVTLLLMTKTGFNHPSIRIPIQIEGDPPSTKREDLQSNFSDHVSEKARIRFPMSTASPDQIVLGSNAAMLDNDDGLSQSIPPPTDDKISCLELIEDMAASLNPYDFLTEKMKDLEWAIFLASLTPLEFGSIIAHVNNEFAQPRVGALLAQNFGGDFTCAHCGAAIQNTSEVFRSEMVEGLLGFCSDLAENNLLIRDQLDEFEQIVVALHALNDEDDAPPSPPPTPKTPSKKDQNPPKRTSDSSRESRSGKPPTRIPSKKESTDSITPKKEDICMGDDKHPGTVEYVHAVKCIVAKGAFQEFCPPVFRKIKQKFKDRRFLMRPFEDLKSYWREPSNRELIQYVGSTFDSEKLKKEAAAVENAEQPDIWNQPANGDEANGGDRSWKKSLNNQGKSDWDLAVTIHSYASGMSGIKTFAEEEDDDWDEGPSAVDICFDRAHHPGNAALVRAVRSSLKSFADTGWSPPIYKAIKNQLRGRRFFVKTGEGQWKEATQQERRKKMSICFEKENKALQGKRRGSTTAPLRKGLSEPSLQPHSPPGRRRSAPITTSPLGRQGKSMPSLQVNTPPSRRRSSTTPQGRQGVSEPPVESIKVNTSPPTPRRRSSVRDANRSSVREPKIQRNALSMKKPRDFDICYGLDRHPGTVSFHMAIIRRLEESGDKEFNPAVYKAVRAQLVGRRFFIRPDKDQPWKEATAQERVEWTRKHFESNRRKVRR